MENIEITIPQQCSKQPVMLVVHVDYTVFPTRDIALLKIDPDAK